MSYRLAEKTRITSLRWTSFCQRRVEILSISFILPAITNSYTIELRKKEMEYFNLRTFERSKVPNLQNRPARTFGAGLMEWLNDTDDPQILLKRRILFNHEDKKSTKSAGRHNVSFFSQAKQETQGSSKERKEKEMINNMGRLFEMGGLRLPRLATSR